jgi:putative membrane protein insertion efficiency factor
VVPGYEAVKRVIIIIFIILICFPELYCDEREDLLSILHNNPVHKRTRQNEGNEKEPVITNEFILFVYGVFRCYKILLSSQASPSCNFIPSCSEYAFQSVYMYGIVHGILLAGDRLLRCNGLDMKGYLHDPESGRYFDPVERNIP